MTSFSSDSASPSDSASASEAAPGTTPGRTTTSPVNRRGMLAILGTGIAIALTGRAGATAAASSPAPSAAAVTTTQPASLPGQQTNLGPARAVQAGGGRLYQAGGTPVVVTQPTAGRYQAFNAICPHAGCTCSGMPVPNDPARTTILCPCHGSEFNAATGAVVRGPATKGLTPLRLRISRGRLLLG